MHCKIGNQGLRETVSLVYFSCNDFLSCCVFMMRQVGYHALKSNKIIYFCVTMIVIIMVVFRCYFSREHLALL